MSTWLITILSMIIMLFIMMQFKVSKHHYHSNLEPMTIKTSKPSIPWETKWMKIYSLSLPLQ